MKKLMRLVESGEKTAFVNSKAVQYTDEKELQDLKDNPDVKTISTAQGKRIKEEIGRKYTAEESAAVGKAVGKSLLKVLRGQGDEVVDIRLTGVGVDKFGIKVKYGNDKGGDTFRFTLNPDTEDITLDLGRGDHQQLVDFIITQGNTVSMPTPELESKLADAMKKYTSEPSDAEYDPMVAMEPESDPSQMSEYIGEKKLTKPELRKREEIVKAMKKEGEPKNARTYAIATAQAKKLAEDLDLGHQDDEPGMLLGDLYSIMKSTKELYEMVSQFEGHGEVDFPHWWQAKIIKAKSCLQAASQYLDFEVNKPQQQTVVAALGEAKGTCCHKCGHVHVKGTSHPTPYLTGQKNCKYRD